MNLDIGGRVERMQNELDVPEQIVRDLLSVAGADIVVVADDSGSMGGPSRGNHADDEHAMDGAGTTRPGSRTAVSCRGPHGRLPHPVLERSPDAASVRSASDCSARVETLFYGRQPRRTPLATRLRPLLSGAWHRRPRRRDGLLILADHDGTASSPTALLRSGAQLVGQKSPKVFCTFMMCTEEDDVVEQYNKSLDSLPGVDITDDYVSEKKEVEKLGNKLKATQVDGQGRARRQNAEIRPRGREAGRRRRYAGGGPRCRPPSAGASPRRRRGVTARPALSHVIGT